ncbi:DinB family protein [Chitinophaga solisilvae]|uniref:DinB family protein n=1 Tax=Chitinophaga solisilvae TaxID=1233460 RepID=A0A433WLC9_9BACT|nr:DinB family protein [Chitinophaga solisilvae]NSL85939.1 DinB family protein [Chitinophaga solisilvae]
MKKTAWFDRSFPAITDNGLLPSIIERLSGTPARVEEMISRIAPSKLTLRHGDKWTIHEQAGHLGDMEPLWLGRLEDLQEGATDLRVADLTNQRTHNAQHNNTDIKIILQHFREQREIFVNRLLQLEDVQLEHTALHPRLKTPMRIIDLACFVAEHDDHHLSAIRELS